MDGDGKKFTFDAKEQIVLRCGKSSITLTRAGKVLIKGAYLLSRSSGVNRVSGLFAPTCADKCADFCIFSALLVIVNKSIPEFA